MDPISDSILPHSQMEANHTNRNIGCDNTALLASFILLLKLIFSSESGAIPSGATASTNTSQISRFLCFLRAQVGRMPYTAPAQLPLPASSPDQPPSPSLREVSTEPVSPSSRRPSLPRSFSSTSYVHRHRRSPSLSKPVSQFVVEGSGHIGSPSYTTVDPHASLRQSPPPVTNSMIPTGVIISPPESGANSSDDEETTSERRRGRVSLEKLDTAIRSLQQERQSSTAEQPGEGGTAEEPAAPASEEGSSNQSHKARPSLKLDPRRIFHSRSSTESSIPKLTGSISTSDEEEDPLEQRPMVRKKSGELVRPALRPASRRRRPSSMPGTPTYAKNVHFDTQLEHIKHFLQLDKPLAVSAETSPVETYSEESEYPFNSSDSEGGSKVPAFEWELRLANFPKDPTSRNRLPVRLERMYLSSDNKNLVGVVSVANLAFHKLVVARFTLDYWKTVSEVTAEYDQDIRRKQAHEGYDRFKFTIKLADQAHLESKTMFVCIRYNVGGQEFWDNNNSMNYQVDFAKKYKNNMTEKHSVPVTNGRHVQPLPRSRLPTSSAARPMSYPPSFDDFVSEIDATFSSFGQDSSKVDSPLRLTKADSHDFLPETPRRREKPARQAFGNRYDFGISLSVAMQSKDTSQDRTMLSAKAKSESRLQPGSRAHSYDRVGENSSELSAGRAAATNGNSKDTTYPGFSRPSTIVSSKPHLDSSVYKELVDKYCFVSALNPPVPTTSSSN
jgi:hypothetical protein